MVDTPQTSARERYDQRRVLNRRLVIGQREGAELGGKVHTLIREIDCRQDKCAADQQHHTKQATAQEGREHVSLKYTHLVEFGY